MPLVRIETQEGRTAAAKRELLDAVHDALTEVLRIPEADRQQRLVEYTADNFDLPSGKSADYILVTIDALPGRSVEVKEALFASIIERFEGLAIDPKDVVVVLNEVPLENWGIQDDVTLEHGTS